LLFSFENLHRQYLACRRNKRNTLNALHFEARQEQNLLELRDALQCRSYRPGRSVCFFVEKPKLREIFAADFRDRVVHHVLVDYLERIWEPIFIHDSYACRKGKGIHAGVQRLRQFIRQVTANGSRRAWYLQLDVRNFFMSIDKDILYALLKVKIVDCDALWLAKVLVYHDCTADYVIKGDANLRHLLPAHKTLFGAAKNKGLPIGNLNSQFFANVYLNELDQFVKHRLKCRYYLRYCDDFVLLAPEPEQLMVWREQIRQFLAQRLQLTLNDQRERLRPVSNGVDFLGYVVRRDYALVRRRVVHNLHQRLRAFERMLVVELSGYSVYRFDEVLLDQCRAVLASYLGHFLQADSFGLRQSVWAEFGYLAQYFAIDEDYRQLTPLYRVPSRFANVRQQYGWFRCQFANDVVLFQVGCFYEFYHPQDQQLAQRLGLKRLADNRRRALYGVPVDQGLGLARRLIQDKPSVLWVCEQSSGVRGDHLKPRVPHARWVRN
jgi:RNA-directed DNA polymerase